MKTNLFLALSLSCAAPSLFAANFGSNEPAKPAVAAPAAATVAATAARNAPQVVGLFRIVKPDGATVIQQAPISVGGSTVNLITVAASDAFLTSGGKCAFNVKYDELATAAATNTTNRLYANDALIAQNTKIDLVANVLKSVLTQPYLSAGQNNVKIVVNADSATPSIGWVRVNVTGSCSPAPAPQAKDGGTKPAAAPASAPVPEKKVAPPPPPPVKFAPGSAEWNTLNNAWGYSNYAVTQLKGKGYARYADLVKLNADLTAVINAKTVEQGACNALITRWNSFVTEKAFLAAMAAVTPPVPGKK